ncbi:MAG: alanine racemase [Acidimicrobiales bacterium]
MAEGAPGRAWVEIDLAAISHNVAALAEIAAPAHLCAVVKADAYGHGAVACAVAALEAGASELAVAIPEEGIELREAGIEAPILLLSEPGDDAMAEAFARALTPTLYTGSGVAAAGRAADGSGRGWPVEVKVDTGMHRVGAAPGEVAAVVAAVMRHDALSFAGLWTHLAVADEVDNSFTKVQLDRFAAVRSALAEAGHRPGRVHAANSAGAISWPDSRLDVVRCGIAIYGHAPSPAVAPMLGRHLLRPALSFKARVALVRSFEAGERFSYGLARPLEADGVVATVPVGYADGLPRAYFERGGEVLVGGRRCRLAGAVTMDQIVVDCGAGASVQPGDEVVLIGHQGGDEITAEEWAHRLGTIQYEVVTRIGPRVPRIAPVTGEALSGDAGPAGPATAPAVSGGRR